MEENPLFDRNVVLFIRRHNKFNDIGICIQTMCRHNHYNYLNVIINQFIKGKWVNKISINTINDVAQEELDRACDSGYLKIMGILLSFLKWNTMLSEYFYNDLDKCINYACKGKNLDVIKFLEFWCHRYLSGYTITWSEKINIVCQGGNPYIINWVTSRIISQRQRKH